MLPHDLRSSAIPSGAAGVQLLEELYDELRGMARRSMAREARGATLQPTALVHEVLLRIGGEIDWERASRQQLLCWAARAMRRILVEAARRRRSLRAGAGRARVGLDAVEALAGAEPAGADVLALDEALEQLAALDPRLAELVHLRYFAGLGELEVARVLARSERSVRRDWQAAKLWLYQRLTRDDAHGS
jgi:RNA polymerase sigma factor (TIGR02999 family)